MSSGDCTTPDCDQRFLHGGPCTIPVLSTFARQVADKTESAGSPSRERGHTDIRGHEGDTKHGWQVWYNVVCVECPGCGMLHSAEYELLDGSGYKCECEALRPTEGPSEDEEQET